MLCILLFNFDRFFRPDLLAGLRVVKDDDVEEAALGGGDYSYVYLGTNAGLLEIEGTVINHSGYYDQDGGVMTTSNFTNDSSHGFNLDNNADFRATYVTHNAGTLYMWRNAIVRGEYAGGGMYYMCNFTNNSNIQMGNFSFNGGTFVGHLTNNGSFNYTQGDFSASTLTNYGTVNLNAPFTCARFVQNAYSYTVSASAPITATGTGWPSAFENNGNLTIPDGATITVVDAALVNNNNMYAGGTVNGDVENNDYLLPAQGSGSTDTFHITGDFTQSSAGELRIRLGGTGAGTEYDRVVISGVATFAGELDVRLTNEFTPSLGDSFEIVRCLGGHSGEFNPVYLPALADGLEWDVDYQTNRLVLTVVEEPECPGDINGDGKVDLADLGILLATYGLCPGDPGYNPDANLADDGDPCINIADLGVLLAHYGTVCG